ncbi:MAG: hypothetical protein WB812_16890 [Woeseiaceae bacterium]
MKKLATGLITALLFVGALAAAQPHRPPFMDIDKLAVLLDLNDSQKSEVDRVLTEQRDAFKAKHDEVRASGERPSYEEMQAHHQQMVDDMVAKLQNTLSPKQIEKFKILMEPPPMRGGPHHGMPRDDSGEAQK